MTLTRRILVSLGIITVAVIIFWQLEHHRTQPSSSKVDSALPHESHVGTTTITNTDYSAWAQRLAARSGANHLASVTSTFKEASDCLLYYFTLDSIEAELNDERLDDLSHRTLATLETLDATFSRRLEVVRQTEASCVGSDREHVARVYTDAMFNAALMGSVDAQICYLQNGYFDRTRKSMERTALVKLLEKRYVEYAPAFTKAALERNDPYAAKYALNRYVVSTLGPPELYELAPKADPYLTWRVARLASLRATPEERKDLELSLAMFEKLGLLEPSDIQRADAWATETYEREFIGQPAIDLNSSPQCYSSPELAP